MACIYADAHSAFILYHHYDFGYLFKGIAELGSLPCSVLNNSGYSFCFLQSNVDRFRNQLQAFGNTYHIQVTAWMKVQTVEPELSASPHLFNEGSSRLSKSLLFGTSQINEITVMRQNL